MKKVVSYFAILLFTAQGVIVFAQQAEKPRPTFTLSIEEDRNATLLNPALHRVRVEFTRVLPGVGIEQFHPEAKGMYNMIVLRNGAPTQETDAMRELRSYRETDRYPTIQNPWMLKSGGSWITPLDISDYYDMTRPGTYQITVTRESLPLNLAYSVPVRSNTITIVVPSESGASNIRPVEKPRPSFELSISQDDPDEQPPPTTIQVELENTSRSVIREAKCWPFMGMYNLFVSRNGEPVPENDEMRRLQKSRANVDCPGNETLNEIKPGDDDTEDIPLGNFFDVSKPGSYVVYVTRETYPWNPAKSVSVESNTISFVVPPPPTAAIQSAQQ